MVLLVRWFLRLLRLWIVFSSVWTPSSLSLLLPLRSSPPVSGSSSAAFSRRHPPLNSGYCVLGRLRFLAGRFCRCKPHLPGCHLLHDNTHVTRPLSVYDSLFPSLTQAKVSVVHRGREVRVGLCKKDTRLGNPFIGCFGLVHCPLSSYPLPSVLFSSSDPRSALAPRVHSLRCLRVVFPGQSAFLSWQQNSWRQIRSAEQWRLERFPITSRTPPRKSQGVHTRRAVQREHRSSPFLIGPLQNEISSFSACVPSLLSPPSLRPYPYVFRNIMACQLPTTNAAACAASCPSSLSSSIRDCPESLQHDLLEAFLSRLDRTCVELLQCSSSGSSSLPAAEEESKPPASTEVGNGQGHRLASSSSSIPLANTSKSTPTALPSPSSCGSPSKLDREFKEENCLLPTVLELIRKRRVNQDYTLARAEEEHPDSAGAIPGTENEGHTLEEESQSTRSRCTNGTDGTSAPPCTKSFSALTVASSSSSEDDQFCCGGVFRRLHAFFEDFLRIPPSSSSSSLGTWKENGQKSLCSLSSATSAHCEKADKEDEEEEGLKNEEGQEVRTGERDMKKNRKESQVLFPRLPRALLGRITKLLERPPAGLIGVGRFRRRSPTSRPSSSPPPPSSACSSGPPVSSLCTCCSSVATWRGGDPQVLVVRPLVYIDQLNSTATKRENRKKIRRKGRSSPLLSGIRAVAGREERDCDTSSASSSSFLSPDEVIVEEDPRHRRRGGEGERNNAKYGKEDNNELMLATDQDADQPSRTGLDEEGVRQEQKRKRERRAKKGEEEEEVSSDSSTVLTPFPTTFWLCDDLYRKEISTLEVQGLMKEIEKRLREDAALQTNLIYDNLRYIALRWLLLPKEVLRHYYSVSSLPACRKKISSSEDSSTVAITQATHEIHGQVEHRRGTEKEKTGRSWHPGIVQASSEERALESSSCHCRLCRLLNVFRERGIGGVQFFSSSIRCLHMHFAYHLVLPPSSIGQLVETELSKRNVL